jgi:hypothetical protein
MKDMKHEIIAIIGLSGNFSVKRLCVCISFIRKRFNVIRITKKVIVKV